MRMYKCKICGKEFQRRRSLGGHYGGHAKKGEWVANSEKGKGQESMGRTKIEKVIEIVNDYKIRMVHNFVERMMSEYEELNLLKEELKKALLGELD
jgi:transposase-like protein